jgi:phosphate transport system permease protein
MKNLHRYNDRLFALVGFSATMIGLVVLGALLADVLSDGLPRLNWQFITSYPSRKPGQAGILAAWVGTAWLMALTGLIALPLGIGAATYLEEYARKSALTDFIEINIANLAGVPSIIYGLLGLGLFVRWMRLDRSLLAGAMTLSLLVIPVVILSSREALRAIPSSVREASYALGASRWQTIRYQVLPAALPGILTGIILAMSRAIGETAPLMAIGALTYVGFLPGRDLFSTFPINLDCFLEPFSALPIQIFNWVSRPQKAFSVNAAAGILVLLLITFIMNGMAVYLRYRYQKGSRW